jgi:branched-chain amino acid aminotransferase
MFDGVMRRQIISLTKNQEYKGCRGVISPFDLQKADELFYKCYKGIQPITQYRKKI